jgi:hypothetical protein
MVTPREILCSFFDFLTGFLAPPKAMIVLQQINAEAVKLKRDMQKIRNYFSPISYE